ncbi:claudin-4-like [Styela clava]
MFQEVGLLCAFMGCAGFLWAQVDPCWKKTSADLNVQPYDICYGLYKGCTITAAGEWICDPNLSETPLDLDIPARTQLSRASEIIAVILTAAGLLIGGLSSDCSNISNMTDENKRKYRTITGWIFIIAAIMPAGAAAWWTRAIVMERYWYKYTGTPGLQFTINRAIYITFGAAFLNIVAGLCFTVLSDNGCCNSSPKEDTRYNYQPPKEMKPHRTPSAVEYV